MTSRKRLDIQIPLLVAAPLLLFLAVVPYTMYHMRQEVLDDAKQHEVETSELLHHSILVAMKAGGGKDYRDLIAHAKRSIHNLRDLRVYPSDELFLSLGRKPGADGGDAPLPGSPEQKALVSGDESMNIVMAGTEKILTRIIPVKAAEDCLPCHKVPRNTLMGVLSMSLSLSGLEARGVSFAKGLFLLVAVMVAFAGAVAFVGLRSLVIRPILKLTNAFERRKKGDLTVRVPVDRDDEVGQLTAAFNDMGETLSAVMEKIRADGFRLRQAVQQISEVIRLQESGAIQQSASINETTSTMEELSQTSRQIAETAEQVAAISTGNMTMAVEGLESVHRVERGIQEIQANSQSQAQNMSELSRKIKQIGHIVEIIDDIADKSDLLALNAALEGAKAGDVGKGFSLVASEMRRLAESVLGSTKEIKQLIEEIQEATRKVVMTTEAGVAAVGNGVAMSASATQAFQRIVDRVKETTDAAKQISLSTQQQKSGTDQVVRSMVDMLDVSRQGAEGIKQVTQAASELLALATELNRLISQFQAR